jgi:hypothetical protein
LKINGEAVAVVDPEVAWLGQEFSAQGELE